MTYPEECKDLVLAVHELDIPKDEMILIGGAALALYEIRDGQTIDLVVSPKVMHSVLENADNPMSRPYRLGHIGAMAQVQSIGKGRPFEPGSRFRGYVTFMPAPNDDLYQATFEELHDEAVDIDDILVSPLKRILDWKRHIGREKDLADIALIEERFIDKFAIC